MITTNFPNVFYSGDSVSVEDSFTDFLPSNGWTANYILLSGDNSITIRAISNIDTNNFEINIDTTDYAHGLYKLNAVFTNVDLSKRRTIPLKDVEIKPDLTSVTSIPKSWAEIALENVQAYLKNPNSIKHKSYEIHGRKLEQMDINDIKGLISWLQGEVNKEKMKGSKKGRSKILMKFTNK